jgi:hypothetical protein
MPEGFMQLSSRMRNRLEVLGGLDQSRGDVPLPDDELLGVDVPDEGVERRGALAKTGLELVPLGALDQPRDRVERELLRPRVALEVDPLIGQVGADVRRDLLQVDRVERRQQLGVVPARFAVGIDRLVEVLRGVRRPCLRPSLHGRVIPRSRHFSL